VKKLSVLNFRISHPSQKNNFKLILGKKRVDIYYELLVAIILVPAIMLLGKIAFMKFGNTKKHSSQGVKSSAI